MDSLLWACGSSRVSCLDYSYFQSGLIIAVGLWEIAWESKCVGYLQKIWSRVLKKNRSENTEAAGGGFQMLHNWIHHFIADRIKLYHADLIGFKWMQYRPHTWYGGTESLSNFLKSLKNEGNLLHVVVCLWYMRHVHDYCFCNSQFNIKNTKSL